MSSSLAWSVCSDPALGYDLAHWQGRQIPWADALKLGIRWAVVKTWSGRSLVDSNVDQIEGARAAGLLVGRYAWMYPDSDLDLQIGAWTAAGQPCDELPLTIDFEEPGTAARGRSLLARLEHVIERVSDRLGRRPILYTGHWYWQGYCYDLDSQIAAECPLWLAAYPRKASTGTRYAEALAEVCGGVMPRVPRPWAERGLEPVMWQFDGDKGLTLANGVDVDVNTAAWGRLQALVPHRADTEPAPPTDDAPTWPKAVTAATPLRAGEGEHTVRLVEADFEDVT